MHEAILPWPKPRGLKNDPVLESAVALTDYAVTARYPGEAEPIGQTELEEAIRLAKAVVVWAESQVHRPAPNASQP